MASDHLSDLLEQALEDTKKPPEQAPKEPAEAQAPEPKLDLTAGLMALTEGAMAAFLKALPADDLITLLSRGDAALKDRVSASLSEDSAKWLAQNLELMGESTEAAYQGAVQSALQTLETLAGGGKLAWPPPAPDQSLLERIGALLQLASAQDLEPLKKALAAEEPLLALGVKRLLAGDDRSALTAALEAERTRLEAQYRQRQEAILLAVLQISEG